MEYKQDSQEETKIIQNDLTSGIVQTSFLVENFIKSPMLYIDELINDLEITKKDIPFDILMNFCMDNLCDKTIDLHCILKLLLTLISNYADNFQHWLIAYDIEYFINFIVNEVFMQILLNLEPFEDHPKIVCIIIFIQFLIDFECIGQCPIIDFIFHSWSNFMHFDITKSIFLLVISMHQSDVLKDSLYCYQNHIIIMVRGILDYLLLSEQLEEDMMEIIFSILLIISELSDCDVFSHEFFIRNMEYIMENFNFDSLWKYLSFLCMDFPSHFIILDITIDKIITLIEQKINYGIIQIEYIIAFLNIMFHYQGICYTYCCLEKVLQLFNHDLISKVKYQLSNHIITVIKQILVIF